MASQTYTPASFSIKAQNNGTTIPDATLLALIKVAVQKELRAAGYAPNEQTDSVTIT